MNWKKSRLVRWTADNFTITETMENFGRPFRLDGPPGTDSPEFYETLEEAKSAAAIRNQLAVFKAENARLRAELARIRDGGTWERHPTPADFEPDIEQNDADAEASYAAATAEASYAQHVAGNGRGIPRLMADAGTDHEPF